MVIILVYSLDRIIDLLFDFSKRKLQLKQIRDSLGNLSNQETLIFRIFLENPNFIEKTKENFAIQKHPVKILRHPKKSQVLRLGIIQIPVLELTIQSDFLGSEFSRWLILRKVLVHLKVKIKIHLNFQINFSTKEFFSPLLNSIEIPLISTLVTQTKIWILITWFWEFPESFFNLQE